MELIRYLGSMVWTSSRDTGRPARQARFEASRSLLLARLSRGCRVDPWFRSPGVRGLYEGREVEALFPGGFRANALVLSARLRRGERFNATVAPSLLRWLGGRFLRVRGTSPPDPAPFGIEQLLRDYGVTRVSAGRGLIEAHLEWDPAAPEPERVFKVLSRLHRLALCLEGDRQVPTETRGELRCPYCHGSVGVDEALARCEACGTPYHPTCFEENRGCAILGCGNRVSRTRSGRLPQAKGSC